MNKNLQTSTLINEINALLSDYHCPVSDEMHQAKEHLLHSIGLLAPIENQSYHLLDLNESLFISTYSIHQSRLFKPGIGAYQPLNSAELIELTHPDDVISSLKFELAALQFLLQIPEWRANEFGTTYTRRLMNKKGEFEYYSINYKVVVCHESGKPWLLMMHCKYCPLAEPVDENQYRIVSIEPHDLIRKSRIFDRNEFIYLTGREKEVIEEVNKGFEKDKAAKNLHISPETIKTHFRHIDKKTGLSFIHQACLHIVRTGILPIWVCLYLALGDDFMIMDLMG